MLAVSRYAKFQTNRYPGGTLITRKMTQKLSYRRAQTLTANKEGLTITTLVRTIWGTAVTPQP